MGAARSHQPRLPRVPFNRPMRLLVGPRIHHVRASNLSLGGMFIEAERAPTIGERVSVALENGDQALPLGDAEVVWRRSGSSPGETPPLPHLGFGLRFVALGATGRSLIEAVVRHGGTSSSGRPVLAREEPTKPDLLGPEPKTDPLLN